MAFHISPSFGLPFARAGLDDAQRYHVVCPVCGERCYPDPAARGADGLTHVTTEDMITKDANATYARHFRAAEQAEVGAILRADNLVAQQLLRRAAVAQQEAERLNVVDGSPASWTRQDATNRALRLAYLIVTDQAQELSPDQMDELVGRYYAPVEGDE